VIIEIRRHGEYCRKTGGLTLKAKTRALELSGKYDRVFSAQPNRCVETAITLSGKGATIAKEFNDIQLGEYMKERVVQMLKIVFSYVEDSEERILIVTHSNFIAAISCFLDGKKIPENLDNLPVIPHLGGITINISKQKL